MRGRALFRSDVFPPMVQTGQSIKSLWVHARMLSLGQGSRQRACCHKELGYSDKLMCHSTDSAGTMSCLHHPGVQSDQQLLTF